MYIHPDVLEVCARALWNAMHEEMKQHLSARKRAEAVPLFSTLPESAQQRWKAEARAVIEAYRWALVHVEDSCDQEVA